MKILFLFSFALLGMFDCHSQTIILLLYEEIPYTKDSVKSYYDIYFNPDQIGKAKSVNVRYIINFDQRKLEKFEDGELTLQSEFEIISELMPYSKSFFIVFELSEGVKRGLVSEFSKVYSYEIIEDKGELIYFEKYSIY